MDHNTADTSALATRYKTLLNELEAAYRDVSKDKTIDLSPLAARIEKLCEDTLSAAPLEAAQVKPLMHAAIARLNDLETALKAYQKRLKTRHRG